MNPVSLRYRLLCIILALILIGGGCSELQEDLLAPPPRAQALTVHSEGWSGRSIVDPAQPPADFHGNYIRAQNWQMSSCWTCHGKDYAGGISQVSCKTCHAKSGGPENCTTCHGDVNPAPPRDLSRNVSTSAKGVGAHQSHLSGSGATDGVRC